MIHQTPNAQTIYPAVRGGFVYIQLCEQPLGKDNNLTAKKDAHLSTIPSNLLYTNIHTCFTIYVKSLVVHKRIDEPKTDFKMVRLTKQDAKAAFKKQKTKIRRRMKTLNWDINRLASTAGVDRKSVERVMFDDDAGCNSVTFIQLLAAVGLDFDTFRR
tara:strand:- start:3454 stop:3927 length:474 start_codon:yes stop_codon:yes gene_type:complete